ncbi:uncharacterized protein EV422DRAFT_577273 [Fimicolochytrium jonesii]|uniref:uncharacterized protein n=1 Tax=Fimicolochytrium jonesii TaxID=1396493 RepID=UPI0022FE9677|nr:uncharacterized protein EV422DRAFT_577273 [Fimicolochytrium jonesii]KAI8822908.1 hypothetical protein EV422DRAFT_577273 [Fimicolochytrium jonesii]
MAVRAFRPLSLPDSKLLQAKSWLVNVNVCNNLEGSSAANHLGFSYSAWWTTSSKRFLGICEQPQATTISAPTNHLPQRQKMSAPASSTPSPIPSPTGAGSTSGGSRIALFLGLSAVGGLLLLCSIFFLWRRHVQNRPGYQDRRIQREDGFSLVPYRLRKFLGTNNFGREGKVGDIEEQRPHRNSIEQASGIQNVRISATDAPALNEHAAIERQGGGVRLPLNPLRTSGDTSPVQRPTEDAIQRPSLPAFRPSHEILPPRLCKTYLWQSDEDTRKGHANNSPLSLEYPDSPVHEKRNGWDATLERNFARSIPLAKVSGNEQFLEGGESG